MPGRTSKTGIAVLGEPRREQRAAIDEPRLADAVLAAIGRRHLRRHRGDEHDRGAERRVGAAPRRPDRARSPASGSTGPAGSSRSTSSKLSSVASSRSARTRGARPALLTSALIGAERARTSSRSRARSSRAREIGGARSATSPPSCRSSSSDGRRRRRRGGRRRAPGPSLRRASARAMPRPMPRVPPVTSARASSVTVTRVAVLAGPKNVRYGAPSASRLHVQRRLARVVVAPLARLAARRPRAGRHVVPAVRPVIDRVQQQTLMIGGRRSGTARRTACRARCSPACS